MSRGNASRGPGIRCPPPFIFVGALLAAAGLDRWLLGLAIDSGGRGPVQSALGWLLMALGLAVAAWGLITLARARTTFFPDRDANRLVAAGPYRYTRNPMYAGMTLLYSGGALLTNTLWTVFLLPCVLIIVTKWVIGREEQYLARTFGEDYSDFCRRVPRWF
jgi:protein-S-isoprenylcysteine O-methyltransferase Ste14